MTRKANRLVEKMVKSTSRRGFLDRIARLAGGVAFVLAGLAVGNANAAKGGNKNCCVYWCGWGEQMDYFITKCTGGPCKQSYRGCMLVESYQVADASQCK
jgi:hypothetical protein